MKKINDLFFLRPWAIKEDIFNVMIDVVTRHINGDKLSKEEIEARIGSEKKTVPDFEVIDGVAHIPIYGIIAKRISMVNGISQAKGTAVEAIERDFKAALADGKVEKILLDIDSPGGSVDGIDELSELIFESRGTKPIIAHANGMMASAAYYIGSAADKIYASKSSEVGSIGVYAAIHDFSVWEHNEGIKTQIFKAGKFKAAGHPSKPLTDDEKSVIQAEINRYYDLFVAAVQRNRNMSTDSVEKVADGRVFIGDYAVEMGLVDDIARFDTLLKSMIKSGQKKASATAESSGVNIDQKKYIINKPTKEESMEITLEKLKAENKDIVDALISEGKAIGAKEGKEAGKQEGITAGKQEERVRVTGIFSSMPKGMEAVAIEAVKEGKTIEQVKDAFLVQFQAAAPESPGPAVDPQADKDRESDKNLSIEDRCKKEWEKNPKLQEEFASLETYTGYKKGVEKGYIKVRK